MSNWAAASVNTAVADSLVPAALQSQYLQPATREQSIVTLLRLYNSAGGA